MTSSTYTTLVLFGKDSDLEVSTVKGFSRIMCPIIEWLNQYGLRLKCNGRIGDEIGRNLAPRSGLCSPATLCAWQAAITKGPFWFFEVFSDDRAKSKNSMLFASIHKQWTWDSSDRLTDKSPHGGQICITIAIESQLLRNKQDEFTTFAKRIASLRGWIWGYIEASRPWGIRLSEHFSTNLINYIHHDVPVNEYGRNKYKMSRWISRLYKVNFISRSQFIVDEECFGKCKLITNLERIGKTLYCVEIQGLHMDDVTMVKKLSRVFRIIPTAELKNEFVS